MKWKISILAIAALLLTSGVLIAAAKQDANCYSYCNTEEKTQNQLSTCGNGSMQQTMMQQRLNCSDNCERIQSQPLPAGDRLMQQLRNRIRDTLGTCQDKNNLSELTGVITYDGTNFFIDEIELHFGPNWYITSAISNVDYDKDGQLELIKDELLGLVSTTITVEGHYQSDNWMSIFTINGEDYREPGQPIWTMQNEMNWGYRHGGHRQP